MHHYFGSKDQLFLATMDAPVDPAELMPEILDGGRDGSASGSSGMFARVWDGPTRPAGLAAVRSRGAATSGRRGCCASSWFQVLRRVVGTCGSTAGPRRRAVPRGRSQLIGLVMVRYILKVEPLASASHASLIVAIGPNVQRYLTGEVELPTR